MEDVGIFYCHLVYFIVIWYIFLSFDMLYQEKSGNPVTHNVRTQPVLRYFSSDFKLLF
jgi:hypothetical protein